MQLTDFNFKTAFVTLNIQLNLNSVPDVNLFARRIGFLNYFLKDNVKGYLVHIFLLEL